MEIHTSNKMSMTLITLVNLFLLIQRPKSDGLILAHRNKKQFTFKETNILNPIFMANKTHQLSAFHIVPNSNCFISTGGRTDCLNAIQSLICLKNFNALHLVIMYLKGVHALYVVVCFEID